MIVLIGVDGSGKSTAARRLAQDLTAAGNPARYFENAGGRPIIDALAHRLGCRDGRHLLGHRLHLAVEATIRWLAIARAIVVSTVTRRVAIMDRYTYCQYALIRVRAAGASGPSPGEDQPVPRNAAEPTRTDARVQGQRRSQAVHPATTPAECLIRRLYSPFPGPDATFYLAVPPDEAARRVQLRGRDVEDPLYLAAFAAAYRSLPEFPNWTLIDASTDADSVAAAIQVAMAETSDTV